MFGVSCRGCYWKCYRQTNVGNYDGIEINYTTAW